MERIGREVERVLVQQRGPERAALAAVTAAWPAAVGAPIARHAWPSRIARDGTLHVATSSAAWAHELAFHAEEILDRLRSQIDDAALTRMRCAPGPVPEAGASEDAPEPGLPVPPEVLSEAAAVASAIDDPELRELVSRAARASLLKARSGRNF